MNGALFCISWDSYLKQVSLGFSSLQQNSEFVDMTLAADGHLVKVHQNIVALASPYIKAMLQSASCPHPVIFLNNMSHEILTYLLAYIYMGEVKLPIDLIGKFIDACKALKIRGVDNITAPENVPAKQAELPRERQVTPPDKNFTAQITINTQNDNGKVEVQNNNDLYSDDVEMPFAVTTTVPDNTNDNNYVTTNIETAENCQPISEPSFDISTLDKFIIVKPKGNMPGKLLLDTNVAKNPIEIISDISLNTNDWETTSNSKNMETNNMLLEPENVVENTNNITINQIHNEKPIDIILNTNQYLETNQNQLDLNTNIGIPIDTESWPSTLISSTNPININISTDECQPNSDERTAQALDSEVTEQPSAKNTFNLKLSKTNLPKTIKKIRSHVRIENQANKVNKITLSKQSRSQMDKVPHYTVSNRGSLQLLLECFLYNLHHQSSGGRKKRWRCIDYRKNQCQCYIDTDEDVVTAVSTDHAHPNHDKQIINKIRSNIIFTSLSHASDTITNFQNVEDSTSRKPATTNRRKLKLNS